jgi:hypothetical protein
MTGIVRLVFKTIMTVVIFFFTLNAFTVAIDTMTVHSRVSSLSSVIVDEATRHNCVPDATVDLFLEQLNDIVGNSGVAVEINSNITSNYTDKYGVTHTSLSQSNENLYGDILTLVIEVRMQPTKIFMNPAEHSGSGNTKQVRQIDKTTTEYVLSYSFQIPCLFYNR